ncbi:uncharacterized protein LOC107047866 isoform X1 [Diachasma alloeum]|uniref:uncharacterized protein LOC107047866 isoform X1 n=1 Tax=Diachasma alloeum TaxID=454923 RepID=UPI0007384E58|nr:uncharacterized protein LOC107047866 isoform X1 [Diachasma alloeum]
MIRNRCIILIMISISANLSAGQPLPEEPEEPVKDQDDKSLFNLPFLQFKNGGVRVNFAGYHAEAGLGGLLGGSGTRGGLYAGVGTPFGPHASADIGGALGGDKGAGGLRARAGLGNGLPEAAAGLGGNLDGSNGGGNGGRLYAGASNGIKTRIVTKDIGVPDIDQSNIQVIPKKSDVSQAPADSKPELIRREAAAQDDSANAVEPIPIAVVTDAPQYAYPTRRCRRKRLCTNFAIKKLTQQQYPGNLLTPDLGLDKPLPGLDAGIVERSAGPEVPAGAGASGGVATDATGYKGVAVSPGAAPGGPSPPPHAARRTVFDDIFNIPIATLTAVNQLLNSKLG